MSTSTAAATPTFRAAFRHFFRTRTRKVAAVLVVLALFTVAAAALFVDRATLAGGGSSGKFDLKWGGQAATVNAATTLANAKAPTLPSGSITSNETLNLPTGLSFFPGDRYVFDAQVFADLGSASGYISGVSLPGLPAGYTARIVNGCGLTVGGSDTSYKSVTVEIAATDGMTTDGKAWTLTSGAGVEATQGNKPASVTCAPYVSGSAN